MRKKLLILLILLLPFIALAQSTKNVTTTKVYALTSQGGELQDVKKLEQLNYFKISKDKIKFYKNGNTENELIFNVISASIEKINGGLKLTTTRLFMGSEDTFNFMLFDNGVIIMSYLSNFFIYHNLTESGLNYFLENNF